eukprot:GHVT01072906.1.p1 GENE.GHVT01072906.1~~GHVT01072906.1.p1  ORF type:complete len:460 (+),score=32.83 GHVT01072906.1:239-1618(+)
MAEGPLHVSFAVFRRTVFRRTASEFDSSILARWALDKGACVSSPPSRGSLTQWAHVLSSSHPDCGVQNELFPCLPVDVQLFRIDAGRRPLGLQVVAWHTASNRPIDWWLVPRIDNFLRFDRAERVPAAASSNELSFDFGKLRHLQSGPDGRVRASFVAAAVEQQVPLEKFESATYEEIEPMQVGKCHIHFQELQDKNAFDSKLAKPRIPSHDLSDDLLRLLANPDTADFTVTCMGSCYAVHKHILMARSTVFAGMLRSPCHEQKSSTMTINDAIPSSVSTLLHFFYTDKLPDCPNSALPLPTHKCVTRLDSMCNAPVANVTSKSAEPPIANCTNTGDAPEEREQVIEEPKWRHLLGVLNLADIYNVPKLRDMCADRLCVCVATLHEEVCEIYEAPALSAVPKLKDACTQRLLKIFSRIRSTPEFLRLRAQPDLLLQLLDALHAPPPPHSSRIVKRLLLQ